jgi:chromosome segregation ATPase
VGHHPTNFAASDAATAGHGATHAAHSHTLDSVLRVNGRYAQAIRRALGQVVIVDTFDEAGTVSAQLGTSAAVATRAGDVFRGGHLVSGGGRDEGHGILVTKREIKELREKLAADQESLHTLTDQRAAREACRGSGVVAHADG